MRYRHNLIVLTLIFFTAISGCEDSVVEKPANLISRDRMVDMLTDIHMADAIFQTRRYTSDELRNLTEADFYYSVLRKHKVADSTFEQSLIYYSSYPKDLEKIYSRVLNRLNELEQEQLKRQQEPVDIGTQQPL
jgi:hypothetical protein